MVHLGGKDFEDADGDVAASEGEPVEEEGASVFDTLIITAPILKTIGRKVLEDVETF